MRHRLRPTRNGGESPHTTAHHMAEAVTFLMRVAAETGWGSIALQLNNVRSNLIRLGKSNANGAAGCRIAEDRPGAPAIVKRSILRPGSRANAASGQRAKHAGRAAGITPVRGRFS
jgi:hypothetical protein